MEGVKAWIYDHDARNQAYWQAQAAANIRYETRLDALSVRLTALERRVVWIAAGASATGGAVGQLFPSLLG